VLYALENAAGAAQASAAGATASENAARLARAHLRHLARTRLIWSVSAAIAIVALAAAVSALEHGRSRSTTTATGAPPRPPAAESAPTASGDDVTTTIIDSPFARTLCGTSGMHDPAKSYGQEIIALLDRVWPWIKQAKATTTGINHVIYGADGAMFAGVELTSAFAYPASSGLEMRSVALPRYAYHKHVGPYAAIPGAFQRMEEEIRRRGLVPVKPVVEIYGHWTDDDSKLETDLLISVEAAPAH
jgi:hypothetical protein